MPKFELYKSKIDWFIHEKVIFGCAQKHPNPNPNRSDWVDNGVNRKEDLDYNIVEYLEDVVKKRKVRNINVVNTFEGYVFD